MVETSVTINAGIQKVWALFTDLSSWNAWNTVVTVLSLGETGRITKGAGYTCRIPLLAFLLPLEPFAEEVVPCEKIVLTGQSLGIGARHEFLFAENDGKTTVTSRETFTGIPSVLPIWILVEMRMRKLTDRMLHDLKRAAETVS
jgi:hypothetical protein